MSSSPPQLSIDQVARVRALNAEARRQARLAAHATVHPADYVRALAHVDPEFASALTDAGATVPSARSTTRRWRKPPLSASQRACVASLFDAGAGSADDPIAVARALVLEILVAEPERADDTDGDDTLTVRAASVLRDLR